MGELYLEELLDTDLLRDEIDNDYIRINAHPYLNYYIFNYTPKTQYENHWNDVTRICRGLIVGDGNVVIARPFAKFFNYGHDDFAPVIAGDSEIEVTDKIDGSLGILYPDFRQPTGYGVATRGSFTSTQAEHATALYQQTHSNFQPRPDFTYLFEIVYPENRIVVDYGQDDSLYLIGIIRNLDGVQISVTHPHINIPRTTTYKFNSFEEFLTKYKPRKGVEGVVVRDVGSGALLKFKTEEYVELHKITFGLNARVVWERIQASDSDDFLDLPTDYLRNWARKVAIALRTERQQLTSTVEAAWEDLYTSMLSGVTVDITDADAVHDHRKNVAGFILSEYAELQKYLFALIDGRPISDLLWKAVKPRGDRFWNERNE